MLIFSQFIQLLPGQRRPELEQQERQEQQQG